MRGISVAIIFIQLYRVQPKVELFQRVEPQK